MSRLLSRTVQTCEVKMVHLSKCTCGKRRGCNASAPFVFGTLLLISFKPVPCLWLPVVTLLFPGNRRTALGTPRWLWLLLPDDLISFYLLRWFNFIRLCVFIFCFSQTFQPKQRPQIRTTLISFISTLYLHLIGPYFPSVLLGSRCICRDLMSLWQMPPDKRVDVVVTQRCSRGLLICPQCCHEYADLAHL